MKKIVSLLLALVIVLSLFSASAFAQNEIKVVLDGQNLEFDVPSQIIESRTMVPMRKIFEAMGASVEWNGETRTVTATKDYITVIMQIDNKEISVCGENITLDVPPQIVNDRTMVPARAVAESLMANVVWDGETSTVQITSFDMIIDEVCKYPNPKIDFSKDDGTMSELHKELRLMFEQTQFPEKLFENSETLKDMVVNDPEAFLEYVDNEIWGKSMNTLVLQYMVESEEEFIITKEEDIYKFLNEITGKFSLHAYQNYAVDALQISNHKYMILLSMADICDDLKVQELDKMLISNYVAVVYDAKKEKFSYYLLEKSLDNYYALCSVNENMSHRIHGFTENNKKAFIEAIIHISNEQ